MDPLESLFIVTLISFINVIQLLVAAVVLNKSSHVFRILRYLSVPEEVKHVFELFLDPLLLLLRVHRDVSIVFLGRIL